MTALVAAMTLLGWATAPSIAESPPSYHYVALGDSYTAAPLVPTLQVAGGCFRSTNNYPSLVARDLAISDFTDVSCSGADTTDMTEPQATAFGSVPPQLDALSSETNLVTVGIGGNDFDVFGTLITKCPALAAGDPDGAPCRRAERSQGQDRMFAAIAQTRQRIIAVVEQIQQRAPQARVLLVGYPQLVPNHGTCPALLPMAVGDYHYVRQVNQRLTSAVRQAAARTHVGYVDIWRASREHSICSPDPWVNGQHTDPSRAAAYHPFEAEQQAVAGLIEAQLAG